MKPLSGSGLLLALVLGCSNPHQNEPASRTETEPKATPNSYDANNTGRNTADRNNAQATPGDQGNNSTDLNVTQQIRQALMDESNRSVTAKNVKVITTGGKVTLRGPVQDATERSRIEAIAERIAGAGNVTSQLELETPKS
jgi:osmotically-inducible protein OsmY